MGNFFPMQPTSYCECAHAMFTEDWMSLYYFSPFQAAPTEAIRELYLYFAHVFRSTFGNFRI